MKPSGASGRSISPAGREHLRAMALGCAVSVAVMAGPADAQTSKSKAATVTPAGRAGSAPLRARTPWVAGCKKDLVMVIAERRRAGHSYGLTDAALNDLCEKLYTQAGAVGDADRLQLLRMVFEESDKANPAPQERASAAPLADRRFNGWLPQCRTDTNRIVAERRKAGYGYTIGAGGVDQICGRVYGDGARPVTGAALDGAIRAIFTRMEQEADRKLATADPLRDPRYVAWAPECRSGANTIVAERVAKGYNYRVSASAIDRLCLGIFSDGKQPASGGGLERAIRTRFKQMEKVADRQVKADATSTDADVAGGGGCCCAANRIVSEPAWDMDGGFGARLFVPA